MTTARIDVPRPRVFRLGVAAIVAGVLLHVPDLVDMVAPARRAAAMPDEMADTGLSVTMALGMALLPVGLTLAAWGLLSRRTAGHGGDCSWHCRALDRATLSRGHMALLVVLELALVIDVMKPATLGFVLPGLREEYGLDRGAAALLPMVALIGTTIGSLLWGTVSDRIGRRAAILLATLFFIGTAVCGAMPVYPLNLLMCFLMGASAGGMLPIVYALLAESVPARHRSWLVVLHGGLGTVGGYLAASGVATLLEPRFGWRVLWFVGLPTGVVLLLLNRWVPESPRFLLQQGRLEEAEQVMRRYGVVADRRPEPIDPRAHAGAVTNDGAGRDEVPRAGGPARPGITALVRPPLRVHTATVVLFGLAWGLVNWGFVTFLPVMLQESGTGVARSSRLLFVSALLAVPATVLVAWLYGRWSGWRTMVVTAAGTAAALLGIAVSGARDGAGLAALVVVLLACSGGVIATLSPYAAEIYPTELRGRASGVAAGSSKAGGILAPPLVLAVLALAPSMSAVAVVTAVPTVLAAWALVRTGVETRGRSLEDLAARPSEVPERTGDRT
ncbi:MFS transporter [Geodermatophilus sp. SYSU D00697]